MTKFKPSMVPEAVTMLRPGADLAAILASMEATERAMVELVNAIDTDPAHALAIQEKLATFRRNLQTVRAVIQRLNNSPHN
ncbi:MAG: hypothetical protein K8T25_18080 [Planctomycetia bacterium]|nr:hypothetical protein [Planctomycetia bacterium]